jgi:uncharacterized protein (TIRG00374 family)
MSSMDENDTRGWGSLLLRASVILGAFVVLTQVVGVSELLAALRRVPLWLVGVGLVVELARTWLMGVRWRMLIPVRGTRISLWTLFKYMLASRALNFVMPGSVGGDIARSAALFRRVDNQSSAQAISVAADRLVGLFSTLILGLAATWLAVDIPQRGELAIVLVGTTVLGIGGIALLRAEPFDRVVDWLSRRGGRFGTWFEQIAETVNDAVDFYSSNLGRVARAFAVCVPIHGSQFALMYLIAKTIGMQISFWGLSGASSLVWVVTALPVSLGGLGVRELSYVYVLERQGCTAADAAALSMVRSGLRLLSSMVGLPFIWTLMSVSETSEN